MKKSARMFSVHSRQVLQFYCEGKSKFRPEQNIEILDIPFLNSDNLKKAGEHSVFI